MAKNPQRFYFHIQIWKHPSPKEQRKMNNDSTTKLLLYAALKKLQM